jgi:predicted RNase H-like HicB family nuclease
VQIEAVFMQVPEGYIGFAEGLSGANTQGETLEETKEGLVEAIKLILEANQELIGNSTEMDDSTIASSGATKLMRYLESVGCRLLGSHEHHRIYVNSRNKQVSAVPHLEEIGDYLVGRICNDLGISRP